MEPGLTGRRLVDDVDPVHPSERRALTTPAHHLCDGGLGPLEDGLDAPTRHVPDPPSESELVGSFRARGSEEDTLHPPGETDPHPTHRWMVAHHPPVPALR